MRDPHQSKRPPALDGIRRPLPAKQVLSHPEKPSPAKRTKGKSQKRLVATLILGIPSLYLLVAPFWPELIFQLQRFQSPAPTNPYHNTATSSSQENQVVSHSIPTDNRLVIPQIGVDAPILEGTSEATLDKGIWHRPSSSTPNQGSNTVLTAHRFKYLSGHNTFYHLDKIALNDSLFVYWNGREYEYKVTETRTVAADQAEIETASRRPTLTLYTCTPLWTARNRLVVVAEQIN